MTKVFDTEQVHRCAYCGDLVQNEDKIIMGRGNSPFLTYHRDCWFIAKAERAHNYQQMLRSLEPMRKECL